LLILVAVLATGVLLYLGDGNVSRSASRARRIGRSDASRGDRKRGGYLSFEIRIEKADGSPAAGANLVYEGPASGKTKVDADGTAHVGGLSGGFYTLRVRAGGETGTQSFKLREPIHLGTLRLAGTVVVRGHAFGPSGAALSEVVVEALGAAAQNDIAALSRALGEPDAVAARATTNDDGRYELKVAAGRRYALRAVSDFYAVARVAARRIAADETIDFHLVAGATVGGRVFDERGLAVSGARVLVVHPGLPKAEAVTSSDGSFKLTVEPLGNPTLVVRASGFAPYFERIPRLPATRLRVQLERGIDVKLRVVAEHNREIGLAGISVIVDMEAGFASGTTDGEGRLTLRDLPTRRDPTTGGDHVIVWGEGYAAKVQTLSISFPPSGPLDLGSITMGRGGSVRGRVLEQGSGRPVAGALVRSWGGLPPAIALAGSPTAVSRSDGSFLLEGVPLNATRLFATHEDHPGQKDLAALLAGKALPGGKPLFAQGERTATRDVVLPRGGIVRGTVSDADGNPAAGATVHVVSPDARAAALVGGASNEATTDDRGHFALSGVPDSGSVPLIGTHPTLGRSAKVMASPGEPSSITLRAPISLSGEVVDKQQRPVEGVRISAGPRVAVSGKHGAYTLKDLDAGTALVRFDHPGYLVVERPVPLVGGKANQRTKPVVLERGPGVAGTVVDENKEPIRDAMVTASLQGGAAGDGRPWGEAQSDEQGRFTIHGLAKGSYRLTSNLRGHFSDAVTVHTNAKQEVRLVLRAALQLKGRILSGDQPVSGAQIEARAGTVSHGWAISRADGSFQLDALPPGKRVDLVVRHDAYKRARESGVQPGRDPIVISLDPGIQVGGMVQLPDGTPVPDALVEVIAGTVRARLVMSDTDGRFLAGGLPKAEVKLRVLESGLGLLVSEPVRASAGARDHKLIVIRGGSITGMVRLPDGSAADRVRVTAIAEGGRVAASAWVDRPGSGYALRGLAPGSYTVRAERDPRRDDPRLTGEVPAVPAGSRNIEIRLGRR